MEELPDQKVSVWCNEEKRFFNMMIKDVERVSDIRVTRDIMEWAVSGRSGHVPQDALQALDVVLKEAINLDLNFYNIGRQHFPMDGETLDVGFGKEVDWNFLRCQALWLEGPRDPDHPKCGHRQQAR